MCTIQSCTLALLFHTSIGVPIVTSAYSSLALELVSSVHVRPFPPHNLGQYFAYLLFSSNVLLSPVQLTENNCLWIEMSPEWFPDGIFLWSPFKWGFLVWFFFFPKAFTGCFCPDPLFIYTYAVVYSEVSYFSFPFLLYTVLSLKYLCSNLSPIPEGLLFVCFTIVW